MVMAPLLVPAIALSMALSMAPSMVPSSPLYGSLCGPFYSPLYGPVHVAPQPNSPVCVSVCARVGLLCLHSTRTRHEAHAIQ